MKTSTALNFFLTLARAQAFFTRRFDGGLNGLSLSEFMILLQLSAARDQRMRRTDLAETVGLTASGITRLLAPMEKIGLVKREADPGDARVSIVALASGGRSKLRDSMDFAEVLSRDLLPAEDEKKAAEAARFIDAML